jgi:hypothetical protein
LPRLPPDFDRDEEPPPLFAVDGLPLDDLLPPVFDEDLDRELEPADGARFDVDEDERPPLLFAPEAAPDFDDAVLPPPVEFELARPLPPVFLPEDLFVPVDPLDEPLLRPPVDLDPELELFDVDDGLRLEVDPAPPERLPPDAAVLLAGAIVSAAAPTAPTAAPVAAPAKISPATSITLSTILDVVDRVEREELLFDLLVPFFEEEVEDDAFAIGFLPYCSYIKINYLVISN